MKALEFVENKDSAAEFEFLWGQKMVLAGNSYWLRRLCLDRLSVAWKEWPSEEIGWDELQGQWSENGLFGPRFFVVDRAEGGEKKMAKLKGGSPHRLAVLASEWKGKEADCVIDCDLPFARDLADWLQLRARQQGYELLREAATILAQQGELCEVELQKLVCYAGGRNVITRADAEALVCTATGEARAWQILGELKVGGNPWPIFDAIFAACEDERETAFAFVSQLGGPLKRLVKAVQCRRAGKSGAEAFEVAGIETYRQGEAARTIGFLKKRLFSVYDWLLEIDGALKGSQRPKVLCAVFVANLLGKPEGKATSGAASSSS